MVKLKNAELKEEIERKKRILIDNDKKYISKTYTNDSDSNFLLILMKFQLF